METVLLDENLKCQLDKLKEDTVYALVSKDKDFLQLSSTFIQT